MRHLPTKVCLSSQAEARETLGSQTTMGGAALPPLSAMCVFPVHDLVLVAI